MERLTDLTDSKLMPQLYEKVSSELSEEKERYIINTLYELDIDKDVLANQMMEIKRLNGLLEGYKDLEEQGLLIRLPCKAGDAVYIVGDKFPAVIEKIVIMEDNHIMFEFVEFDRSYEVTEVWDSGGFELEDIGKTVFLTKEEAEAKLREMEERE